MEATWVYLAEKSGRLEVADRFRVTVEKAFLSIQRTPFIGRSRSEDLKEGLRSLPARKYLIIYRVDEVAVYIIRVLHGGRDVHAIFREE
jgi:plasmid stabilization system protein ParE